MYVVAPMRPTYIEVAQPDSPGLDLSTSGDLTYVEIDAFVNPYAHRPTEVS